MVSSGILLNIAVATVTWEESWTGHRLLWLISYYHHDTGFQGLTVAFVITGATKLTGHQDRTCTGFWNR